MESYSHPTCGEFTENDWKENITSTLCSELKLQNIFSYLQEVWPQRQDILEDNVNNH